MIVDHYAKLTEKLASVDWGKLRNQTLYPAERIIALRDSGGSLVYIAELSKGSLATSADLSANDFETLFKDPATVPTWAATALQKLGYIDQDDFLGIDNVQHQALRDSRIKTALRLIRSYSDLIGVELTGEQLAHIERMEGK
ncbi:hypothetical protein [Roseibium aggregatum]|uniref:Uncharacterized protein n=1 Tax=Roseibium aggregatum TaxID=187304 RepID=A0A0M6Y6G9_9HYPH|nr:hypothetical protein [Roseibium aggregatum]CTQ45692.1 hypothetical protein LAL4801_04147 [Roseibium aggregatum]